MKLKIIHFRGNLAETLRKSKMIETDVLQCTERQYGVSVKLQKTFALQFVFVNMFVCHKGLYVATVWSQIAQRISESLNNFFCFLHFDLLSIEAKQEAKWWLCRRKNKRDTPSIVFATETTITFSRYYSSFQKILYRFRT